jgi:ubiquinone/menaquinone biosynthesis C-methylase UbiE
MSTSTSDSTKYKELAEQKWQKIAPGWHRWRSVISDLMRPATEQMLSLAGIGPESRVLDIAAGDGDQSIIAARRVGPGGYVLATDISPELLTYTAASAQEAGLNNLETQVMDGEKLELENDSFDAVICRLGLMLLPDLGQAMSEIYRVLKPDGRAAAIVFTTPDKNPWMSIPAMIALKHAQVPPPQPGQPGLFSLGSDGVFENAFQAAGFRQVKVHRVSTPLHLSSASECARLVHDTAGAIHTILSPLHENGQQAAWNEIQEALRQFEGPDGFESPCEVFIGAGLK